VRTVILLSAAAIILGGCGRSASAPAQRAPGGGGGGAPRTEASQPARDARAPARGPRHLDGVPPGHYPKPGECRLWVPGKPPGQQARATSCSSLRGNVPAGAFVLYGGRAWDADYDWVAQSRRERGSVPDTILDVLRPRR
jgi:hypothetical protein